MTLARGLTNPDTYRVRRRPHRWLDDHPAARDRHTETQVDVRGGTGTDVHCRAMSV
jgi:hypothetical protein